MSKQSEAKEKQGYLAKSPTCSGCANLKSDLELPTWMQEHNEKRKAEGYPAAYGDELCVEKNLRCGIGGFAVKKTAVCPLHVPKATA